MFTFKKIALVGVAAFAAFSMSCSDPDDGSGSIDNLKITDSTGGILLSGTITANEGVQISAISVTSDGNAAKIQDKTTTQDINKLLPASSVSLDGKVLVQVCGDTKGTKTFKITIKVDFDDKTSISSDPQSVEVKCSNDVVAAGTYVLSSAGKSYLDVDGSQTYGQNEIASIKDDIDLVAYYSSTAGDKVWSPCYVSTIGADACGDARIFKNLTDYQAADDYAPGEQSINIVASQSFYLESSDLDLYKVTIATGTDTANKTVTLKVEAQ